MLSLVCELTVLLATASPQGLPGPLSPQIELPAYPNRTEFSPFVDAQGNASVNSIRASGALDFDGDGIDELWFLSDAGPNEGEVGVMMPRGFDVGRYRNYAGSPPTLTPESFGPNSRWTDGASAHVFGLGNPPRIVLCDPDSPYLWEYELISALGVPDPRAEPAVTWEASALVWPYTTELGVYEVEAADHAGDGLSDIYRLVRTPIAHFGGIVGTTVHKETVTVDSQGWLTVSSTKLVIPARCDTLRVGDYNGDGSTDFSVHVPGMGIVSFVESDGAFTHIGGLPMAAGMLQDMTTGDMDRDGNDDLAVVFEDGVLVYRCNPSGVFRAIPEVILRPVGIGPFATAVIANTRHDIERELVALPRDGVGMATYAYDPVYDEFGGPFLELPAHPQFYQGNGTLGVPGFLADIDGDTDLDVVLQTGQNEWLTLSTPEIDLAPRFDHALGIPVPGVAGHFEDDLTLTFPPPPTPSCEIEIVVYEYEAATGEYDLEEFQRHAVTNELTRTFEVLIQPGTAAGPDPFTIVVGSATVISFHYRDASTHQRYASALIEWDGDTGGDGSAVGIRWRLIATPPLPDLDDELLPWN